MEISVFRRLDRPNIAELKVVRILDCSPDRLTLTLDGDTVIEGDVFNDDNCVRIVLVANTRVLICEQRFGQYCDGGVLVPIRDDNWDGVSVPILPFEKLAGILTTDDCCI